MFACCPLVLLGLAASGKSLTLTSSAAPLTSRRDAWRASLAFVSATTILAGPVDCALASNDNGSFVQGTVNLPSDLEGSPPQVDGTPALYITCRPDRPDKVPQAILAGTRGKPPPVLASRFENPSFPFSFTMGEQDLTIEGKKDENGLYWWLSDDLVVSARWDSDGVAATRSPEDLVGRGMAKKQADLYTATIDLTGRGAFGKFATGGSKK